MERGEISVTLVMPEGEAAEIEMKKGVVMGDAQKQEELRTDAELLRSIDRKLDLLLAARDIG